jgi:hypothetical protein
VYHLRLYTKLGLHVRIWAVDHLQSEQAPDYRSMVDAF